MDYASIRPDPLVLHDNRQPRMFYLIESIPFLLIHLATFSLQLVRRRLPPVKVQGGMFNPSVFKSPAFCMYTASSFVAFLGLFTGQLLQPSAVYR